MFHRSLHEGPDFIDFIYISSCYAKSKLWRITTHVLYTKPLKQLRRTGSRYFIYTQHTPHGSFTWYPYLARNFNKSNNLVPRKREDPGNEVANRMECTLIDNEDASLHWTKSVADSRGVKPNSIVFDNNIKDNERNLLTIEKLGLESAHAALCKWATCTRHLYQKLLQIFSLNMQKQCEKNDWEKSDDGYSLSIRGPPHFDLTNWRQFWMRLSSRWW